VLVYTSEPLENGIEVSGFIEATLYVSSDAKDTDFTLKLIDVYPDEGHRIRIEVSSSNFPRFDRNLNTGGGTIMNLRVWQPRPGYITLPAILHRSGYR
jgi:predicted acyl esterase